MTDFRLGNLIRSTLVGEADGRVGSDRIGWGFTSKLRQSDRVLDAADRAIARRNLAVDVGVGPFERAQARVQAQKALGAYRERELTAPRWFMLEINPQSLRLEPRAKRIAVTPTFGGVAVTMVDLGGGKTATPQFELTADLLTGDVIGNSAFRTSWARLVTLSQEPDILPDGSLNEITVRVDAPALRFGVLALHGFFTTTLGYETSVDDNGELRAPFSMTILRTTPSLDDPSLWRQIIEGGR
jgi:hypothetical protein